MLTRNRRRIAEAGGLPNGQLMEEIAQGSSSANNDEPGTSSRQCTRSNVGNATKMQRKKRKTTAPIKSRKQSDGNEGKELDVQSGSKVAKLSAVPIPVLPPEMYTHILSFINDPKVLKNCSRAAPGLDRLLNIRKTTYLFSGVLPRIIDYISTPDILNCRLVCKAWLDSVDNMVASAPAKVPYDDELYKKQMSSHSARMNSGATPYTTFDPSVSIVCSAENLDDFEETYKALYRKPRNPFFGRSLKLLVEVRQENEAWATMHRILQFLIHFGKHIWHLSIKIHENPHPSRYYVYPFLSNFLSTTPNLRSYTLTVVTPAGVVDQQVPEELSRYIWSTLANTTPPFLRYIQSLDFLHTDGLPPMLTRIVVEPYIRNLQKLTITQWRNEYSMHLPILIELNVLWITSNQELENLVKVSACHLQRLSLNFRYAEVDSRILLRVLNRFSRLSALQLDWLLDNPRPPHSLRFTGPPKPGTRIFSLHTLHVCNSTGINYSFLRWFPRLRFLFILERLPHDGRTLETPPSDRVLKRITSREVVQVHKYLYSGQMYLSNVWMTLPLLKTVTFERCWMPGGDADANLETWKMAWESSRSYDHRTF